MDTRMKFLEHELAEQEREMNIKHEAGAEAAPAPVKSRSAPVRATPGRRPIADVEDEPVRAPSPRAAPQRGSQPGTPVRAGTSRHAISAPAPEPVPAPEPEVPVEQLKAGEFEYVMQPDGTIQKRKKTTDHNVIIAGTGYNPGHTSRSMAIRADSDAVIEAVEDDTVMDDSKKRR